MDSYYSEYDARAGSIKIEDISSDKNNQSILRRIKGNDSTFTKICVCSGDLFGSDDDYVPNDATDLGWVGYYIGNNTSLKELHLWANDLEDFNELVKPFCIGASRNKSIQKISFHCLSGGHIFQSLSPFFKDNHNLNEIELENSDLGAEGWRILSLAIAECKSKSLEKFSIENDDGFELIDDTQVVNIIVALSLHPGLQKLHLYGASFSRNVCMALATLLRWSATNLHTLGVACDNNTFDEEGVDVLVPALASSGHLHKLSWYNSITIRGYRTLSTLLESPNSSLECFDLIYDGDEVAPILAAALSSNITLKALGFFRDNSSNAPAQWSAFSKLICDTSSVNKTFLSNHTLQYIYTGRPMPQDIKSLLQLNRSCSDKKQIAIIKILKNHPHFDMQPFFEWDFKILPLAIEWFDRAAACPLDFEANIGARKLSSIYQFIRGMPTLYIESRLKQELNEICAAEMKLEREQLILTLKLQEIKQRKMKIMGRI